MKGNYIYILFDFVHSLGNFNDSFKFNNNLMS